MVLLYNKKNKEWPFEIYNIFTIFCHADIKKKKVFIYVGITDNEIPIITSQVYKENQQHLARYNSITLGT